MKVLLSDYTIISFADVSDGFIKRFTDRYGVKVVNALDDIYDVVNSVDDLSRDFVNNSCYRYLQNEDEISYFNRVIDIDKLLNKYVGMYDKFVIVYGYANVFDWIVGIRLCHMAINNKECVNVFCIPFDFSGKTEVFRKYQDEITVLGLSYYFDCNLLRDKIPSNLSMSNVFKVVYASLFEIACNINGAIDVSSILDTELRKICDN